MKLVSGLAEKLVGQDSAQISLSLFPDSLTYTLQQTGRIKPWQVCAKDAFKHSSGQPIKKHNVSQYLWGDATTHNCGAAQVIILRITYDHSVSVNHHH